MKRDMELVIRILKVIEEYYTSRSTIIKFGR